MIVLEILKIVWCLEFLWDVWDWLKLCYVVKLFFVYFIVDFERDKMILIRLSIMV